jgi:S-adenosylmethionine synthetase
MIRVSEAVLPGHPDKLCDFVAESLVQAALVVDPEAYAQIEAGIWCDQLWLSGGYAARGAPLAVERIATEALDSIARAVNPDARPEPWQVTNAVCRYDVDPRRWSHRVNDQAIVIGWAGYDEKVRFLPPEHFLALEFRDALWNACCGGELARCGPDGKLIVRLREDADGIALEHVLVTLEHPERLSVFELAERVSAVLASRYGALRRRDARWVAKWSEVELLVNPNGPLSDAGSRKDNGQTGRKLVMDYYGPRIPIGGGAIYGKHPSHVDRFGARQARRLAVDAVRRGAGECLIRISYAPNVAEPLDVQVETPGGDVRVPTGSLVLSGAAAARTGDSPVGSNRTASNCGEALVRRASNPDVCTYPLRLGVAPVGDVHGG